ncbi:MAG: protein kinase [Deltaproteobacteria bacterium]|nr:protein kinase [Deltaproteobacteria bacterium]
MVEPLILLDRYEVIRRLAIGGMGEIFLARQRMGQQGKGISRLAIVKTLRPELADDNESLEQFLDEARVAAQLSHPNVVQIFEVGLVRGVHFIAMEYIGGIDLAALRRAGAKSGMRITPRVAAALIRDAALGLDYAHHAVDETGRSLSIVHRDVSPHNIMVRADGLVKVVDFGVALASNQHHETQGDKLKGKIRYMSPEQLLGEDLDGRSDLFSLGIVLWELLAGRTMFQNGANPIDVFQRILAGDFAKPSVHQPDVPPVLDEVVARALRIKREERFARGTELAAALRSFLDGGGPVEGEVRELVEATAGQHIAERVRDLTPRAVSIYGIGDTGEGRALGDELTAAGRSDDGGTGTIDSAAATRLVRPSSLVEDLDSSALEPSDGGALLDAAELSGVLHGDRRFISVLVGLLPGWGALAGRISNVPMGAFAINRLKNLFFRELEAMAKHERGVVVRRGPDSFVLAFGTAEPDPSDVPRAVLCALRVQKLLDDLARDPTQKISSHIGVATGTALATPDDDGPLQIAGSVVERAEALATHARVAGVGVLLTAQVAELVRGRVLLRALPHAPADGAIGEAVHEAVAPAATLPSTRRKKVLIADDAEVFRRIEEEILRPLSYAFVHAKDGAQALKLAADEAPDLILLDVQMPVMDGVQVLSFLKRNPQTQAIPVCVVTTIGRAHDEELLRKGGADAFLTKPVKPGVLIQTVRRLLKEIE